VFSLRYNSALEHENDEMIEPSVLVFPYHDFLERNIRSICQKANIAESYVHDPLSEWCEPQDRQIFEIFQKHTSPGIIIGGTQKNSYFRLCAIVAGFLRNYIDAACHSVLSIHDSLLSQTASMDLFSHVLCVPSISFRQFTKHIHYDKWGMWLGMRQGRSLFTILHFEEHYTEIIQRFPVCNMYKVVE
jgi:hypothetical protein